MLRASPTSAAFAALYAARPRTPVIPVTDEVWMIAPATGGEMRQSDSRTQIRPLHIYREDPIPAFFALSATEARSAIPALLKRTCMAP